MSDSKRTERVEMSPGVFKVAVRDQTFRAVQGGLYERSINTQTYFEDAKGQPLAGRKPESTTVTPPGPKWRKVRSDDSLALLAKSVTIFEGDDFNPCRIVPIE
jgi:hypothetical protein